MRAVATKGGMVMIQITGGTVITMDPAYRVVQADVWIDDSYYCAYRAVGRKEPMS